MFLVKSVLVSSRMHDSTDKSQWMSADMNLKMIKDD